jgi:hypothetical protein
MMEITRKQCEVAYQLSLDSWREFGSGKGRIAPVKRKLVSDHDWPETSARMYVTAFFHMLEGTEKWTTDTNGDFADVCLTNLYRDFGVDGLERALHAHACYIENYKKKPKNLNRNPPRGHRSDPDMHHQTIQRRHRALLNKVLEEEQERVRHQADADKARQAIFEPTDDVELFDQRVLKLLDEVGLSKPEGFLCPDFLTSETTRYLRSPHVKAWVLQQAGGCCESCGEPGPFEVDGRPFLELHHVQPLAEGGSETVGNAVAVCPNCHRAFHLSEDRAARMERLYLRVPRLLQP